MRLFFEDSEFPEGLQEDDFFSESVANSIRKAFLSADLALADDSVISRSLGITSLTDMIFGRNDEHAVKTPTYTYACELLFFSYLAGNCWLQMLGIAEQFYVGNTWLWKSVVVTSQHVK